MIIRRAADGRRAERREQMEMEDDIMKKIQLMLGAVTNPQPPLSSQTTAAVLTAVLVQPHGGAAAEPAVEAVAALIRFANAAVQRAAAPESVALEAAEREAETALTFAARVAACGGDDAGVAAFVELLAGAVRCIAADAGIAIA
jgi:hypothetical protein